MPKARERVCSICGIGSRLTRNKFKVITTVAVEKLLISAYQSRYGFDLSVPLLGSSVHETCYNSLYGWYRYQNQVKEVPANNTCLNPISNNMQTVHQCEHQSSLDAVLDCNTNTDIEMDISPSSMLKEDSLSENTVFTTTTKNDDQIVCPIRMNQNEKPDNEPLLCISPISSLSPTCLSNNPWMVHASTDCFENSNKNHFLSSTINLSINDLEASFNLDEPLDKELNSLITREFAETSILSNIENISSLQRSSLLNFNKKTNDHIEKTVTELLSLMTQIVTKTINISSKCSLILPKLFNNDSFLSTCSVQTTFESLISTNNLFIPEIENQHDPTSNLNVPLFVDTTFNDIFHSSICPTDDVNEEASIISSDPDMLMSNSYQEETYAHCFNDIPPESSIFDEDNVTGNWEDLNNECTIDEDSFFLSTARSISSPMFLNDTERLSDGLNRTDTDKPKLRRSRKVNSRSYYYKRKITNAIRKRLSTLSHRSQSEAESPGSACREDAYKSPMDELITWVTEQVQDKLISLNEIKDKLRSIICTQHQEKLDDIQLRNDWVQRQMQEHSPGKFWFGKIAKRLGTYIGLNNIGGHLQNILSSSFSYNLSQSNVTATTDQDDSIQSNGKKQLCLALFTAITTLREQIRENIYLIQVFHKEPEKITNMTSGILNSLVPMLLRNFIGMLTASNRKFSKIKSEYAYLDAFDIDLFRTSENWLKNISICYDIINIKNDRIVSPKHILLANEVFRHAHSYELLTVLNRFGVVCSHRNLSRLYHRIAKNNDTSGSGLPSNIRANSFMIEVHDNFDMNKETLRGEGSLHVVNRIILQSDENDGKLTNFSSSTSPNNSLSSLLPVTSANTTNASDTRKNHLNIQPSLYQGFTCSNHDISLFCFNLIKCWFGTKHLDSAFSITRPCILIPLTSGFFASYVSSSPRPIHHVAFLPPVHSDPNKISTTYECMESTKQRLLDNGLQEAAVVVVDEKIYRNCIQVKDNHKVLFDKLLPYPGEFHIMKNYMIAVWDILEYSGIDTALGELYRGASFRSIMNCSHFNKSLRAMKLLHSTLATLLIHQFLNDMPIEIVNDLEALLKTIPYDVTSNTLKIEWFKKFQDTVQQHQLFIVFNEWIADKNNQNKKFKFWHFVFNDLIGPLIDMYIAIRSADFDARNAALSRMAPLFFTTNHQNYARLCARHITDLRSCSDELFNVLANAFAVQRTPRPFSSIAMDQTIEVTINKAGKGQGGISGRYDKDMIDIWCKSFSYRSLLSTITCELAEYETENNNIDAHIECTPSRLEADEHDFGTLLMILVKERLFTCDEETVTQLFSGQQFKSIIIDDILGYILRGQVAIEEFVKERLVNCSTPCQATLKKMKLLKLIDNDQVDQQSGIVKRVAKKSIQNIKEIDETIIKALMLSRYRPKMNLVEFFGHEFSSRPLSLCDRNNQDFLYQQSKSKVINFLKEKVPDSFGTINPFTISSTNTHESALLIDGGALLQTRPMHGHTALDYAIYLLEKNIIPEFNSYDRIDIVFDSNRSYTAKRFIDRHTVIDEHRVTYYKLLPEHKLPTGQQFDSFLRCGNRATLAAAVVQCWQLPEAFELIPAQKKLVIGGPSTTALYLSNDLPPEQAFSLEFNHEEADTRLVLHLQDAVLYNYKHVCVRSADTDVVFLMISYANTVDLSKVIVDATVRSGQPKYIDCTMIHHQLINKYHIFPEILLALHAISGCDTTSFFRNISKTTFFETYFASPSRYAELQNLSAFPMNQKDIYVVERIIYDCIHHGNRRSQVKKTLHMASMNASNLKPSTSTSFTSIDNLRATMALNALQKGNKSIVLILPPSAVALFHHCRRASRQYQVWRSAHIDNLPYPDHEPYGFEKINNEIRIKWTTKMPLPKDNSCFHSCKCTGDCKRCKCGKYSQPCTIYCLCDPTKCSNRSSISNDLVPKHAETRSIESTNTNNIFHDHDYFCKSNETINSDVILHDSDEDASSNSSDLIQNIDSSDDLSTFG
ncbi:unnamed protein product [Rotaria socialis]|uniref:Tesmin/TSO1-like CXC domain-containing protein n=1 Tax=Rotaria socialis TaxID=392032 RepID=A0A820GZJ8_9BILA|nr:unnamed protein product [Rotaria socialis]CAF4283274.1 unnamed protein product [Rotaria socialis]